VHVDAKGYTHEHVLGPLNDIAIDAQEVGALKGLQAKGRGVLLVVL
jgi:hypothetical protein